MPAGAAEAAEKRYAFRWEDRRAPVPDAEVKAPPSAAGAPKNGERVRERPDLDRAAADGYRFRWAEE